MSAPDNAWKDKYSRLLDDYEQMEAEYKEHIDLLERGLVRSSLAAEGQEPQLDKLLQTLRDAVRKQGKDSLSGQIKILENHLLKSEGTRESRLAILGEALEQLADQLLTCDPDSDSKKGLKRLQKSLKDSRLLAYEIHLRVQELSQLQASVLHNLGDGAPRPAAQGGFISRLLGRDAAASRPAAQNPVPVPAPDTQVAEDDDTLVGFHSETTPVLTLDSEPGAQAPQQATVESADSPTESVRDALLKLLQELPIADQDLHLARQLEQDITNRLDWATLAHVLNTLADLVIRTSSNKQQEFSRYLQQLNQKLNQITGSVSETQDSYQTVISAADAFDHQLSSQVSEIHTDVRESNDLTTLKQKVDQRLSRFAESITRYQSTRKDNEQQLLQRLDALNERVKQVESEAEVLNNQLMEQQARARLDALTGVANRAAWDERLEIEHTRLERQKNPLLLAVIDIDLFKRINDTYGHLAGDKVLKILATRLKQGIRRTDFLARYGGEEFVILLPDTELENGAKVINKLRLDVAECQFHFKGEPVQITFSAGIGQLYAHESTADAFARIDAALYRAKENGRNLVELAEPPAGMG